MAAVSQARVWKVVESNHGALRAKRIKASIVETSDC